MGPALWNMLTHPAMLLLPASDTSFLLCAAAVGTLGAVLFMAVVGTRILRGSRVLAIILATAFTPAFILGLTFLFAATTRNDPGDSSGMLALIFLFLAIFTLPFGFVASIIFVGVFGRGVRWRLAP